MGVGGLFAFHKNRPEYATELFIHKTNIHSQNQRMNRIFLLLLGVMTLTACGKDADEPGRHGNQASEQRELVSVRLEGDLELPYDEFDQDGKALTLVPGTKQGASVLMPTYTEGEKIKAVAYATSTDGFESSGALPLTLTVGKGGRKLLFHGDLNLPQSLVGDEIVFAVFVGFDPKTGNLETYPTTAPHYAKTGTRVPIKNYPVALQARARIPYHRENKQGRAVYSYNHLGLRFRLVGSLIRCALTNNTDKELTVKGLELHGLGATGVKLAKRTTGRDQTVSVTSDNVDPSKSFRTYTLPAPQRLAAGAKAEYYLVYAPLVWHPDLSLEGYVRPILSDNALQAEYADDQTAKTFPAGRNGKLTVTNIVLEAGSPIKPNAIPLQYWNAHFYYKPSSGSAMVKQPFGPVGSLFRWAPDEIWPFNKFTFGNTYSSDSLDKSYYINPKDVQADAITRLGKSVHVPTKLELDGILLPEILKEATDQVQRSPDKFIPYYESLATYTKEFLDPIEVGGKRFLGKSSIWRDEIKYDIIVRDDIRAFFYKMERYKLKHDPRVKPKDGVFPERSVYALRYGKLSPSELADAKGFKGRLAQDNKSRVAYMYNYTSANISIYSCYIGDDPSIKTAKDLYDQGVFLGKGVFDHDMIKQDYRGHKIYHRFIFHFGALYSSKGVKKGAYQHPQASFEVPQETASSAIFGYLPNSFPQEITLGSSSSGLLYRKTSSDNSLVAGWTFRSHEGQLNAPRMVWTYDDITPSGTIGKFTVKELPTGGDRHFAFPLWLMSDAPSSIQGKYVSNTPK